MSQSNVAIVTTVRAPTADLGPWIYWHKHIGIERFYIFFDAKPEPGRKPFSEAGVRFIHVNKALQKRMAKDDFQKTYLPFAGDWEKPAASPDELTARQLCVVQAGLEMARSDGVPWLLHIDGDELFYPPNSDAQQHFNSLSQLGIGYVIYDNHEGLCEHTAVKEPFSEITLFTKNPRGIDPSALDEALPYFQDRGGYFLAYANGKAAVQTRRGTLPAGAHGFHLPLHYGLGRARFLSPAILHYPYSNFESYWRKVTRVRSYSEQMLLGAPWNPPLFEVASVRLAQVGAEAAARLFFERATVLKNKANRQKWLKTGVLTRITDVANVVSARE
ncbi:MAG: hypothetical protein IPK82_20770 [Polyangiaceae bacterium]|nr:hypothetical protein [Polyangiaceae bacterium]